jgi:hypothetical protein
VNKSSLEVKNKKTSRNQSVEMYGIAENTDDDLFERDLDLDNALLKGS